MMKKIPSALLISSVLCGMLLINPMAGEAEEDADLPSEQTEQISTEAMDAKQEDAPVKVDVPAARPDYDASDYLNVSDEKYKDISFSIYPPADDSEEAQNAWQTEVDTEIMKQLFGLYPITEYPEDLLNYVSGSLVQTYQQYADMYGIDFSSFLQTYLKVDQDTFMQQVQSAAQQTLKEEMLLKAVAEHENLTVSDSEYDKGCEAYAAMYGYDSADALRQVVDEETIRISLLMDKTFEYLEKTVQIDLIIETETESELAGMTEAETEAETEA